ncbi:MAG: thioredoxin family protein [Pseudomonadota bacterium]
MFQDGLHVVVKQDCPTCAMIEPAIRELATRGSLRIYVQDNSSFLNDIDSRIDDAALENSFHLCVEAVPTLISYQGGQEIQRAIGWSRADWQELSGLDDLGSNLPDRRPGCGSLSVQPGVAEVLRAKFGSNGIASRILTTAPYDDEHEICYDRGWSDGFPVVPPTPERILRMLEGTKRDPQDIVGQVPPNLTPCTVEKVAINAVMAGCKPEFLPVVLACLETALEPEVTLHGVLCSTCPCSPVLILNGPITERIGMNSGINVLGSDNRANATIGRALNLVVRNVGGGIPGGIDRSTLGGPGKISFCFAENEDDESWMPLHVSRGCPSGSSAVTVFQGAGMQDFIDMRSRTPKELTTSMAASLAVVGNIKHAEYCNAVLVLSPEHHHIYRNAGWSRQNIEDALYDALRRPGKDLVRGAGGIGEGIDPARVDDMVDKFWRGHGLLIVRAGGSAGLHSAILSGWPGGRTPEQSKPITREIHL